MYYLSISTGTFSSVSKTNTLTFFTSNSVALALQ